MEKLLKLLSLTLAFIILSPAAAFAILPYENLKQFENPLFVCEYVKSLYEEYASMRKSESQKNPRECSKKVKTEIKLQIEKLTKENPESAVRLTLNLIVFFNIGRELKEGYNPKNYDKKIQFKWDPNVNNHLVIHLFKDTKHAECLIIE